MKTLKTQATPRRTQLAPRHGNILPWTTAVCGMFFTFVVVWSVVSTLHPMMSAAMALLYGLSVAVPARFREVVLWLQSITHLAAWLIISDGHELGEVLIAWSCIVTISYSGYLRRWYG